MLEVVSLVNFDNPKRVAYLERSFRSFHALQRKPVRHLVFDSSGTLGLQKSVYENLGIELHHLPGASYGRRMAAAMAAVRSDYFLFLPDDFAWIFDFPLEEAIEECRRVKLHELKLTCRGMDWFSSKNPRVESWFEGDEVVTGERLHRDGDLLVSKRRFFRDFHEQFSLACNVIQTDFCKWVVDRVSKDVVSPGQFEKHAYLWLLMKRYYVGYYRMWIPAFHFIDLAVEGDRPINRLKLATSLIPENYSVYNRHFNVR